MTLYLDSLHSGPIPDLGIPAVKRITTLDALPDLRASAAPVRVIDYDKFTPDRGTPDRDIRRAAHALALAVQDAGGAVTLYGGVPGGEQYAPGRSKHYAPVFDMIRQRLRPLGVYADAHAVAADLYYRWGDEELETATWGNRLAHQVEACRATGLPFYLYLSAYMIGSDDGTGRGYRHLPAAVFEAHCRAVKRRAAKDLLGVIYYTGWHDVWGAVPWTTRDAEAVEVLRKVFTN